MSILKQEIPSEMSLWSLRASTPSHRKVEESTGESVTGWSVMRSI